jgi:hypothetical protein
MYWTTNTQIIMVSNPYSTNTCRGKIAVILVDGMMGGKRGNHFPAF